MITATSCCRVRVPSLLPLCLCFSLLPLSPWVYPVHIILS